MKCHVAYYVNANSNVGAGHFMRCLALIEAYSKKGLTQTVFGDISKQYVSYLDGITLLTIRGKCDESEKSDAELLIIDSYEELEEIINNLNIDYKKMAIFEDLGIRQYNQSVKVIAPYFDNNELTKNFVHGEFFTGEQSFLFRKEVENERGGWNSGRRLVISLGGTNLTFNVREIVSIIERTAFPCDEIEIYGIPEEEWYLFESVNNTLNIVFQNGLEKSFIKRCLDAKLVICGCGQTLQELLYIGVPCIGVVVADNQHRAATALSQSGANIAKNNDDLMGFLSNGNLAVKSTLFSNVNATLLAEKLLA